MIESNRPLLKRGLQFDPTINAGHLLTFGGMLVAGFIGFSVQGNRITALEEWKQYQRERDAQQDSAAGARFGELKEVLKEVKDAVHDVNSDVKDLSRNKPEKQR